MPMVIRYTPEFKRDYKKLQPEQKEALKAHGALFQENPFHPLLKTHKLSGKLKGYWAFSVDFRIRVIVSFVGPGECVLLRVGDHSIYSKK